MTQDAVPRRRPKNGLGVAALILTLITAIAPLVIVIVVAIVGFTENPGDVDTAFSVAVLGGLVLFFGTIALLSPLSFVGLVLGVISMWRAGSKAPGVVAIIIGAVGSFGLFGFPFVLGEIVPGL